MLLPSCQSSSFFFPLIVTKYSSSYLKALSSATHSEPLALQAQVLSICWCACLVGLLPGGSLLLRPSDMRAGVVGELYLSAPAKLSSAPCSSHPHQPSIFQLAGGPCRRPPAYLLIPRLTLCLFYLCFPRLISKTTSVSTTQLHSVISLFFFFPV